MNNDLTLTESEQWLVAGIVVGILTLAAVLTYLFFLNHINVNEIGVCYDSRTGNVWVQETPGWYKTDPFTKVINIYTAPFKIDLSNTSGALVVTQKIVQFRKAKAIEYVKQQGFNYASGVNLNSIAIGYVFSTPENPYFEVLDGTK